MKMLNFIIDYYILQYPYLFLNTDNTSYIVAV